MNDVELLKAAAAHPLLAQISREPLAALVKSSRAVRFRPKRTILKEGDPPEQVFCLLQGAVRVFHRDADTEILVKLFRAPALFGEMEVLGERPFLEYVTTLEPSLILLVPAEGFRRLVHTQPRFATALALDLAARLCIATYNERALAFSDVETRLANLLVDYAELFGEVTPDGVRLTVSLSQQSMARDLGVSRKSLTRSLARLREEALVDKREARYLIRDLEALRARGSHTMGLNYSLSRDA